MAPANRRRVRLIQPRLQIRLILSFLGVSLLALTLQFALFTASLSRLAEALPNDGDILLEHVVEQMLVVLAISTLVLLPMTFSVGVLVTFRIAGPLFRLRRYLEEVAAGGRPADCKLRRGDELQDLCEAVNAATAPLRAGVPRALPPEVPARTEAA